MIYKTIKISNNNHKYMYNRLIIKIKINNYILIKMIKNLTIIQ